MSLDFSLSLSLSLDRSFFLRPLFAFYYPPCPPQPRPSEPANPSPPLSPSPSSATTRPRRQLVIIGDSSTVSKGSGYLKRWMDWLEEEAWVQVPE